MAQPAKAQEPSMEEILASIRRIIADDDANKTAKTATEAAKPAAPAARPAPPPAAPAPPPPRPAAVAPPPPPPPAPAPRMAPPEPIIEEEPEPPLPEPVEAEPDMEAAPDDQSSDILDLTESMAAPMSAPEPEPRSMSAAMPQFRTIDGSMDVDYDEAAEPPEPISAAQPRAAFAGEPAPRTDERPQLLSQATSAAVDSAFNALAQTVLVQNARTLEDLVREMLRPMLKAWLDDNLPSMVERMVRTEIERVSRGRMG